MAWYKAGTVTVTNGSTTVTGAGGTSFVSNVVVGDAFQAPDGRSYEIAAVVSATELTLARAYMGATGGGQAYTIQPTSSFAGDLAARVVTLLGTFGAVRDGIGQGLIADGTLATPGLRFLADQDTGWARLGENALGLIAGGVARFSVGPTGSTIAAVAGGEMMRLSTPTARGSGNAFYSIWDPSGRKCFWGYGATDDTIFIMNEMAGGHLVLGTAGSERGRFDAGGNFLVGATSGSAHTIVKGVGEGAHVLFVNSGAAGASMRLQAVGADAFSSAAAAAFFGRNTATGRSVNAGGTVNASGADYAEYMVKADGCGTIAAGDVCGVDRDGRLTRTWADAVSFVVKSTDPAYVGGDTWSAHMRPKPEAPAEPTAPTIPAQPDADASEEDEVAWVEAMRTYGVAQAAFARDHAAWEAAHAAYVRDLAVWEGNLEAARVTVDRIAFAGQVPVNMTTAFAVGDYLIAAQDALGITAIAVPAADITFDQYRRRLGKVWAVRNGRPWIDVQHG